MGAFATAFYNDAAESRFNLKVGRTLKTIFGSQSPRPVGNSTEEEKLSQK